MIWVFFSAILMLVGQFDILNPLYLQTDSKAFTIRYIPSSFFETRSLQITKLPKLGSEECTTCPAFLSFFEMGLSMVPLMVLNLTSCLSLSHIAGTIGVALHLFWLLILGKTNKQLKQNKPTPKLKKYSRYFWQTNSHSSKKMSKAGCAGLQPTGEPLVYLTRLAATLLQSVVAIQEC